MVGRRRVIVSLRSSLPLYACEERWTWSARKRVVKLDMAAVQTFEMEMLGLGGASNFVPRGFVGRGGEHVCA